MYECLYICDSLWIIEFFILLLDYALYFFRPCLHTSLFGPRRHGQLPRNRSCIEYGVDAGQLAGFMAGFR